MNLADHYGGSYLPEGWHVVTVSEFNTFTYNSGSPGVQFTMVDARGRYGKASFVLLDRCLWTLANFAEACGFTQEDAAAYDTSNSKSHAILVNRKLKILIQKGEANPQGKSYNEVVDYDTVDAPCANPPPAPRPQVNSTPDPQPQQVKDADIPF